MKIIKGEKYFTQGDIVSATGRANRTIAEMVSDGRIEKAAGGPYLWSEEQFKKIVQEKGRTG